MKRKKNSSILDLQDIIKTLSDEKIIFKAEIEDLGQDTNFECIRFDMEDINLYPFDYYLYIDTHGHTICGGKNGWFYSPRTSSEFMEILKIGHIE